MLSMLYVSIFISLRQFFFFFLSLFERIDTISSNRFNLNKPLSYSTFFSLLSRVTCAYIHVWTKKKLRPRKKERKKVIGDIFISPKIYAWLEYKKKFVHRSATKRRFYLFSLPVEILSFIYRLLMCSIEKRDCYDDDSFSSSCLENWNDIFKANNIIGKNEEIFLCIYIFIQLKFIQIEMLSLVLFFLIIISMKRRTCFFFLLSIYWCDQGVWVKWKN